MVLQLSNDRENKFSIMSNYNFLLVTNFLEIRSWQRIIKKMEIEI
jgi:hypothetical protein